MIASVLGQIIIGLLIADFLSGVFHWWMDQVGKETWPVVGPYLITPNRLHHEKPLAFADRSYWYRNGSNFVIAGIAGALWYSVWGLSVSLASAVVATALANEIHRLAHQPSTASQPIRVLQQIGLIQSAKGHARHHRPPQNTDFCPITDWLNPILNSLHVWRGLDRLFGIAK